MYIIIASSWLSLLCHIKLDYCKADVAVVYALFVITVFLIKSKTSVSMPEINVVKLYVCFASDVCVYAFQCFDERN